MKIELENCQKSLTLKDFEEIESKLGYALPERLKEFYLQYNGGSTKQIASINKYQEVEIEDFFPFKYTRTRSHTDNFGENNVKCLIAKGICRFVPHSSAGGF